MIDWPNDTNGDYYLVFIALQPDGMAAEVIYTYTTETQYTIPAGDLPNPDDQIRELLEAAIQ